MSSPEDNDDPSSNPSNAKTTATVAAVAGGAAAAATPAALAGVGFGSSGIVAGSIAAGVQSAVYGGFVPAGGAFATATSMGMGGTSVLLLAGPVGVAVGVGVGVGYHLWRRSGGEQPEPSFNVGDSVWARNDGDESKWTAGIVVARLAQTYFVEVSNGLIWKRDVKELQKRLTD